MRENKKIIQLSLISIGIFLIVATYFLYPKIIKNKFLKEKASKDGIIDVDISKSDESNLFENVEYKGLYNVHKPFKVQSKKAHILIDEPDIVYMTDMRVTLYEEDGIIVITSDKGRYNKMTYDCFFENNVKAIDGETTVTAENLDLLATEDTAVVYNNVFIENEGGSLQADKIHYDFETKYYQVSMFSGKKVKIKLIEWATVKNLGS